MKYIKYLIIGFCLALVSSCSLQEESFTEVGKDKYLNTIAEAESVLKGVYRDLAMGSMYGYYFSLYFTLPSDEAKVEGSSTNNFRDVPSNSYTSAHAAIEEGWQGMYKTIYDANSFIEALAAKAPAYSESSRNTAAVLMGEARTLRAMCYFELVRWFGNIILITDTDQSYLLPTEFEQSSAEEVYKFIEKELKYAISVLPYADEDSYRSNNSFRISKGAALGLLAKVYATWAGAPVNDTSKWEDCVKTCKTLVESGHHDLLPDFADLWRNVGSNTWDATESLIEVSFYSPSITGDSSVDASGRIGKWNGVTAEDKSISSGRNAANWKVLPTFARDWPNRDKDKRFELSVADYKYTVKDGKTLVGSYKVDGKTTPVSFTDAANLDNAEARKQFNNGLCPAKWDTELYVPADIALVHTDFSNVNWYILRYADVLLLYAEALNEWNGAPTADAYGALNKVRRRGYGLAAGDASADVSNLTFDEFRQAVRTERKYELAFEGHRRQDLTRWGIYVETVANTYRDLSSWHEDAPDSYKAGEFTTERNVLLPIPLREYDLMDPAKVKQNPGW